jgi:hypothetical protein
MPWFSAIMRLFAKTKFFSIAGDLSNRSPYEWNDITVNVDVFRGKKLISLCSNNYPIGVIKPVETIPFVISCDSLNNTDGLDYKLSIGAGSKYATTSQ